MNKRQWKKKYKKIYGYNPPGYYRSDRYIGEKENIYKSLISVINSIGPILNKAVSIISENFESVLTSMVERLREFSDLYK